ncbi:uncharacterized protein N7511_004157 [Penicillium nucicola]|uniref:uncharacterized protein n=1 Tax=Penicillium nucicola TaxID=1850975 RepID=UPI0025453C3F|nr:uncharacterized protein N7511_004157 [Penicillium nucicola]KAJ5766541.1 hypothetical protein N7511_004157 [Penicillium nucicola]
MPGVPSSRGCEGCRKQKKKCDQVKPTCSRCTRLRIPCIGNGVQRYKFQEPSVTTLVQHQTPEKTIIATSLIDASQTSLSKQERTYLNFFRQNTSKQVASYFSRAFWDQMVHQVGEAQPAVRHAAIGVGAMHWNYDIRELGRENQSLPLQQCGKAYGHLQEALSSGLSSSTQIETVLCSCLVLGALSMIQGDARATGYHLGSGWRLLDQWQSVGLRNSALGARLLQTFTQNKLRWFSLQDGDMYSDLTLPDLIASRLPIVESLAETEETVGFVVGIGWLALQVRSRPDAGDGAKRVGVAVTLLKKLQAWKDFLLESSQTHGEVARAEKMISLLDVWCQVLFIRVSTDGKLEDGETRYDRCLPLFQHTIQLAGKLLSEPRPDLWMGIVTPLVFCALKCRDWETRHEALKILNIVPYSKGKWSMANTGLVIARVIQVESEGFAQEDIIPEASRIDSMRVEFLLKGPQVCIYYCRSRLKSEKERREKQDWESVVMPY